MHVRLEPANIRDLSFICANMRAEDWREIECQWPEGASRNEIAAAALSSPEAWVASWKGQPVAAFGVQPLNWSALSIWAFGARAMWRAVPELTRFILGECVPRWIASGVTRVEARSIVGHDAAHRWMRGMGASEVASPCWGRNGEDFMLFSWTRDQFR